MSKTATTAKFGKVELPINPSKTVEHNAFVPTGNKYIDHDAMLETIAHAVESNMPTLLIGETGTGKTSAIRFIAQETNNSFRRLNLNGATTVDEFVGKILINEKGTYWTDGILIEAMRNGDWLLVDEVNAGLPEVLFVLQSLLDDDNYVVLSDKPDKEVVRPHPNFRLFATCNPSDNYAGTKEMNKALLSRFAMVLEVGFPEKRKEVDILKSKFSNPDEKLMERMVDFANQMRKARSEDKMDFCFSTRELVNWYKLQQFTGGDIKLAAKYAILGKCNTEDKETITSLLDLNFTSGAQSSYNGPFQKGTKWLVEQDITVPGKGGYMVPRGSTIMITRDAVDRGPGIGNSVFVTIEKAGRISNVSLPQSSNFSLPIDRIENGCPNLHGANQEYPQF